MTDLVEQAAPICVVIPPNRRRWHKAAPGELTVVPGEALYGHRFHVIVIVPGAVETKGDQEWRELMLRTCLEPGGYWIDLDD